MRSATSRASSGPKCFVSRWSPRSIDAVTPAAVVMSPSSTTRASTTSATVRSSSIALRCVVAFLPARRPAAFRIRAPVHTLATGFSVPKSRSAFSASSSFTNSSRPGPPGTMTRSRSVRSRRTSWAKNFIPRAPAISSLIARNRTVRSSRGWICFAFARPSYTPTASSSSTPSKSRMPTRTAPGVSAAGLRVPLRPAGRSEPRKSEDFHVAVDLDSLVRDAVRLHGPRMLETPHLDHLDHELDVPVLPLVEAQTDHTVADVLDEAVAARSRVVVLHLRREDARGAGRLELLAQGEQLFPPLRVVCEEHVQEADRGDRHARRPGPFDEIRQLRLDSRDGRLRVRGLELDDVQLLLLQVRPQIPTERGCVRDDRLDVLLEGDEDPLLAVDQSLHEELQREGRLAGAERPHDRDDVSRGHPSAEHLVEAVDPREDESFRRRIRSVRRSLGLRLRFCQAITSGDAFHVHDDEAVVRRDHRRESGDLVSREMGEDTGELLEVHVALARARPRGRPPFEDEAAVRAIHQQLLVAVLEDASREHEVHEPVPLFRGTLHPLDGRDEVPDLHEVRDCEVRQRVNHDDRVARVLVQKRDELFQEAGGGKIKQVVLARPRGGHDAVPEVHAREILEDGPVSERAIVIAVEGRREFLEDDFIRAGEGHVADLRRQVRVVTMVTEIVAARLGPLVHEGDL